MSAVRLALGPWLLGLRVEDEGFLEFRVGPKPYLSPKVSCCFGVFGAPDVLVSSLDLQHLPALVEVFLSLVDPNLLLKGLGK